MFSSIEEAVRDIQLGKVIIIVDDEDRENEGDFVCAAEFITPEIVNFMISEGRGLLCVAADSEIIDKIGLPLMVSNNSAIHGTQFTVSVDALEKTSTGISVHDRANTIKKLADPNASSADFGVPGHVFPLRSAKYGVLKRGGHTEAVADLCQLAGLRPVGVLCEILKSDGSMARAPELSALSSQFGLKMISVHQLLEYRLKHEKIITKMVNIPIATDFGSFSVHVYNSLLEEKEHLAFVKGEFSAETPHLVRIHSECLTGDVFHSLRCDCQQQLEKSLNMIEKAGNGVVIYMRQEGRGIGLVNKLLAYKLQDEGKDTIEANLELGFKADERNYASAAQILTDLGIKKVKLLTNNPDKIKALEKYNIVISERVPLEVAPNKHNTHYLRTKRDKMGHLILQHELQEKNR